MRDILASLDFRSGKMLAGKWCITFWVTMKKHGEISTYFCLKHHCEKKSDIFHAVYLNKIHGITSVVRLLDFS